MFFLGLASSPRKFSFYSTSDDSELLIGCGQVDGGWWGMEVSDFKRDVVRKSILVHGNLHNGKNNS